MNKFLLGTAFAAALAVTTIAAAPDTTQNGKPVMQSGAEADHLGKPVMQAGAEADHAGKPVMQAGAEADHLDKPVRQAFFFGPITIAAQVERALT